MMQRHTFTLVTSIPVTVTNKTPKKENVKTVKTPSLFLLIPPLFFSSMCHSAYVSLGGSLRDLGSVPGMVPGWPGRLGSWIEVVDPGGAWERERSFLSPGVWHTDGSLTAEPSFPAGPVNHSPGLVRISCCFRQLLHTQITWGQRSMESDYRHSRISDVRDPSTSQRVWYVEQYPKKITLYLLCILWSVVVTYFLKVLTSFTSYLD